MTLYLYRRFRGPLYTIGRIYSKCSKVCDSLEPPVRDLKDLNNDGDFSDDGEGKIYGHTAIPEGTYELKMEMSPTFGRKMPYLQGIHGFASVMIHPLTDVSQTKACIGVGENRQPGRLVNPRGWSDIINKMLTEAEARGETNYITIANN